MDAQSQLGGFAHPGMALVLFALLTASNETPRGAHGAPRSIYAGETHRPALPARRSTAARNTPGDGAPGEQVRTC